MKEGYYITKDESGRIKELYHDGLDWLLRFGDKEPVLWIHIDNLEDVWENNATNVEILAS